MHVHLPKPLHGWREFFGEVGIIVVGVLIALGAEQLVEAWHWHEVTGETKAALQDSAEDIYGAMLSRMDIQDCVDRRLAEIGTLLERHHAGKPLGITGPIGTPTELQVDLGTFDMAVANQAFSHMSIADQERYFSMQGSYRSFQKTTDMERDAWQSLQSLHRADTLTPSDWSDIGKAYDRASDLSAILSRDVRGSGNGDWLAALQNYPRPKPQDYSLRFLPRVQILCRPAIS